MEVVYILTNRAMPGICKIGKTSDLEERVKSLSRHSGVPVPFEVFYAASVSDMTKAEKGIHAGFDDRRINPSREFFNVAPEMVREIIRIFEVDNLTPNKDFVDSDEDQKVLNEARSRGEVFNFDMVDIPAGSVLSFSQDENITCKVVDRKRVEYCAKNMSLSMAAKLALESQGRHWKAVQGPSYWKFEGETLTARRMRYETGEE